ncbi:hypothetical protein [Streptomyces sp. NPDC088183]|jgi:hypothetical protein|uniref:hypothetical protein n=1 Tax=Streptomyces sp. NPDC088183 TaxID=3160992 RepID=UPI0034269042
MPQSTDRELPAPWLEILEKSGATAGPCDATMLDEERPADGSAGRLKRYLVFRRYMWSPPAERHLPRPGLRSV